MIKSLKESIFKILYKKYGVLKHVFIIKSIINFHTNSRIFWNEESKYKDKYFASLTVVYQSFSTEHLYVITTYVISIQ